jgi:DNA polymerase
LEPRQTAPDEPKTPTAGPGRDLLQLVRSLRAHVEELEASGGWGLPEEAQRAPAADSSLSRPQAVASARVASAPVTVARAEAVPTARVAQASPAQGAPVPSPPVDPVVRLPMADAEARLQAVADEARVCTRCALHEGRHNSVFSRGGGASGLVFVGEGPGEEEDRQGSPFVGPAGQLLDRMILAMQLGRDDVYVCNIVKCRPPNNRKPEPEEMSRCMPYLAEQLAILQPRVIVALGATAVQGLLGTSEGITRLRGQWKLYKGKIPVMPTFHPAYLLRTPTAKRDVWKDLQEVSRHLNSGV